MDLRRRASWVVIANLAGRRFGRLTVERMAARRARCRCDCGAIKIVAQSALLNGKAVSCGCITREHRMRRIAAAPRAVRQSLDAAWVDAKASAERVLAPIRAKVRWE